MNNSTNNKQNNKHLKLELRGRRGTFRTIDVRGSSATNWVRWTPRLLMWQAFRFQRLGLDLLGMQAWHFQDLHRCPRKLGDELGRMDAAAFDVAGLSLSAPQARFEWQAWHFERLMRFDLRGRHGAFKAFIDVRGSSATNWVGWTPRLLTWQAFHFQRLRLDLRGRHGTLSTSVGRFAWQAWRFQDLQDVRGSSATNWVGWTPRWQA